MPPALVLVGTNVGATVGGWMWGGTEENESIDTIRAALERGITLIDTAPAYGFGRVRDSINHRT